MPQPPELILTPALESIGGAVERVRQMQREDPRVFVPQPTVVDKLMLHRRIEEADPDAGTLRSRYRVTDLGKLALGLIGERG